jgi:hypothetical protein
VGWKRSLAKGYLEANRAAARAARRTAAQATASGGKRAATSGLIGPYDKLPPPTVGGYLDFSGTARPQDINSEPWVFPLGRYVLPRRPWAPTEPIGLSRRDANRHTLIVGQSQSGKTQSIIVPWIYAGAAAGYLVVAIDVKGNGDLLRAVKAYSAANRQRFADSSGRTPRFDVIPLDYHEPSRSARWNHIADLQSDGAINAAAEAICGRARDNDPNKNFHLRDLNWMRGLLELAHDSGEDHTVRTLLDLLADPDLLASLGRRYPQSRGTGRIVDLLRADATDYAKYCQFLVPYLEVLNNDGFIRLSTPHRDLPLLRTAELSGGIGGRGGLVIINAPKADFALSEVSSSLMLNLLLQERLSSYGMDPIPMLLVLDEAPRLQHRIDMASLLSLAASANVSILLAAQEINAFDEPSRDELLANCGTLVVLPGASDTTTKYAGGRLGTRIRSVVTLSSTYGTERGSSINHASETVPVMGHNEFNAPPTGLRGATIVSRYLSHRPVLVDLTRDDLP